MLDHCKAFLKNRADACKGNLSKNVEYAMQLYFSLF